jgi:hypothetical protein
MEFSTPLFDSKSNNYKIGIITSETIESEAFYLDLSGQLTITEPDVTPFVENFVKKFVEKDAEAKWFSSRLKGASVLKKLKHTFHPSDDALPSENGWYLALWIPKRLEIYSTGFLLCWTVKEYKSANPQISSRFLTFSEPPTPRPESPSEEAATETRQVIIHHSWRRHSLNSCLVNPGKS